MSRGRAYVKSFNVLVQFREDGWLVTCCECEQQWTVVPVVDGILGKTAFLCPNGCNALPEKNGGDENDEK